MNFSEVRAQAEKFDRNADERRIKCALVEQPPAPPPPAPTVGRVVLFGAAPNGPFAAIVTGVESGERVSLAVLEPGNSLIVARAGVPFSVEPKPGHWSWPPRV